MYTIQLQHYADMKLLEKKTALILVDWNEERNYVIKTPRIPVKVERAGERFNPKGSAHFFLI